MSKTYRRPLAALVAAGSVFFGLALTAAPPAHADATDIVINEMMTKSCPPAVPPALTACAPGYAPVDAAYEFIELYNRGIDPVDISGWAFTAGIALEGSNTAVVPPVYATFPAGTVIPSHAYFVGSSSTAVFQAVSGQTADFSFAPSGLSSSGETVTLVDSGAATVDTLLYAAASPWPSTPNGKGPSLELVDPFSDNTVGSNWGASTGNIGTPHAQNSVFGVPSPVITDPAANPFRPDPTQDVTVQAKFAPGSPATLTYKVMFGADVTIPFLDNAASVGGANDGTYSAVIPKQPAGNLIRYKINATIAGTPVSYPGAGDTRTYDGVVVKDSALNAAQLPVLEWFIDDAGYNGLLQLICDQVVYPGVITWQGVVYDNSSFRRRGHTSCNDPKPKVEMQLPAGYANNFAFEHIGRG
jgi:hypothetical protein